MKKPFSLGIALMIVLSGCSSSLKTEEIPENTGKIITTFINDCGKGEEVIYDKGGKMISCTQQTQEEKGKVSTGSEDTKSPDEFYKNKINTIDLGFREAKKIVDNILNWEPEIQESDNEYQITQGLWRAQYSKSPGGKGENIIAITLDKDTFQYTIKGSGDLLLHGFSPNGIYLFFWLGENGKYTTYALKTRTGDISAFTDEKTGKKVQTDLKKWTPDKSRLIFFNDQDLYITKRNEFPKSINMGYLGIFPPSEIRAGVDDKYVYFVEEVHKYGDTYYLRIFDINTLEEVYRNEVYKATYQY